MPKIPLPAGLTTNVSPRLAHLPQKSVLEISGPDSQKFLKGLSCKDVDSLKGGYSGFLNASGRVLHTSFIFPSTTTAGASTRQQPKYLITHESPTDHPAPLQSLLPPFKLRAKVKIRDVSQEWDAYSAWGVSNGFEAGSGKGKQPMRIWKMGSGGAAESQWSWEDGANGVRDLEIGEDELGCWDLRAGWMGMGRQILVPKGKKPSLSSSHDPTPADDYHLHRMLLGVPEGPDEIIPGSALPLESCMDLHGGVDFRKGCYLGQELTVRTYHTGATRKRILPIRLIPLNSSSSNTSNTTLLEHLTNPASSFPASSSSGAAIPADALGGLELTYHPPSSSASKKPRSAGKLLSLSPSSNVGLALVRLEMAEKSCWATTGAEAGENVLSLSVARWKEGGDFGKLITKIGDVEYGVYVDQGEAYAAALREMDAAVA